MVACAHEVLDRDAAQALRGARVFVPRSSFPTAGLDEYYWVDLIGLDVRNRQGEPMELHATGLMATCLQHEIDHLNGILFIDHISRLKRERVLKKFQKAQKLGKL